MALAPAPAIGEDDRMRAFYERVTLVYFVLSTCFLMLLAFVLLGNAVWEVATAFARGEVLAVLEGAGLVIIGFAIIETAKFIAEEEILRHKELRSAVESRRSLTKFITIIVIAASLEALVMIFDTSRNDVTRAIYPALLFAASMFALVALGSYQWLSSRIAPPPTEGPAAASIDHREVSEPADEFSRDDSRSDENDRLGTG
jgi:hypothetical protein